MSGSNIRGARGKAQSPGRSINTRSSKRRTRSKRSPPANARYPQSDFITSFTGSLRPSATSLNSPSDNNRRNPGKAGGVVRKNSAKRAKRPSAAKPAPKPAKRAKRKAKSSSVGPQHGRKNKVAGGSAVPKTRVLETPKSEAATDSPKKKKKKRSRGYTNGSFGMDKRGQQDAEDGSGSDGSTSGNDSGSDSEEDNGPPDGPPEIGK